MPRHLAVAVILSRADGEGPRAKNASRAIGSDLLSRFDAKLVASRKLLARNGNNMKSSSKKSVRKHGATEVPDIDFAGGVRGKYAARYAESTNIVVLSPDVAEVFPNSEAVNEALRTLVRLSGKTARLPAARTAKARRLTSR